MRSAGLLQRAHIQAAAEVYTMYVDTMGKIHTTYFREYADSLRKFQVSSILLRLPSLRAAIRRSFPG